MKWTRFPTTLKILNIRYLSSTVSLEEGNFVVESIVGSGHRSLLTDPIDKANESPTGSIAKTQLEHKYKITPYFDQPKNPKILQVSVIGMPNAGKSTLVNHLVGTKVSAVSKKVHTTRKNVLGIKVEGSTQIVFADSPGLVTMAHCQKHQLEHTFVSGPEKATKSSDVIMVVVDASNPRERKKLSPGILDKLQKYKDKESLLVLNKIDLIKAKRKLFDVSTKLTLGIVGGQSSFEGDIKKIIQPSDQEIIAKNAAKAEERARKKGYVIDLPKEAKESVIPLNEEEEEEAPFVDMTKKIESDGWDMFSRVFMVSALTGDGVDDIKEYLLSKAYKGKWKFPADVVTPQDPSQFVHLIMKERLLDNLPQEIPYNISTRIQSWDVNRTGTLCLCIDLVSPKNTYMSMLLGPGGKTISKIADEVRQELSNAFRCDVSLKLVAKSTQKRKNN
jgi:small GTP-binding protein